MNPDTSNPRTRFTGGEILADTAAEMAKLQNLLLAQDDCHQVHALEPHPTQPGRYLYLVETPYATFPRFAVGHTDPAGEDVKILLLCGAKWSAEECWNNQYPASS